MYRQQIEIWAPGLGRNCYQVEYIYRGPKINRFKQQVTPFSLVYLCQRCGSTWARVTTFEGNGRRISFWAQYSDCPACGLGSLLWGDHFDEEFISNLPYDFLFREIELWTDEVLRLYPGVV